MFGRTPLRVSLGAAAVLAALLGVSLLMEQSPKEQAREPTASKAPAPRPAAEEPKAAAAAAPILLYCQFYVFTEQRPRLALLFEVSDRNGAPAFSQVYLAEDNGERTDYDGKDTPRPGWRYDPTTEPKAIASIIKVADSSQFGLHDEDIAIELYNYEPNRNSTVFFEASLKNVHFQNLPGKCRQAAG